MLIEVVLVGLPQYFTQIIRQVISQQLYRITVSNYNIVLRTGYGNYYYNGMMPIQTIHLKLYILIFTLSRKVYCIAYKTRHLILLKITRLTKCEKKNSYRRKKKHVFVSHS